METLALPLEMPRQPSGLEVRAFSSSGCVVVRGTICSVFVGGTLLGEYDGRSGTQRRSRTVIPHGVEVFVGLDPIDLR